MSAIQSVLANLVRVLGFVTFILVGTCAFVTITAELLVN